MTPKKLKNIENNFRRNGAWKSNIKRSKTVSACEENIINVFAYFHASPQASIRSAVDAVGVTKTTIERILALALILIAIAGARFSKCSAKRLSHKIYKGVRAPALILIAPVGARFAKYRAKELSHKWYKGALALILIAIAGARFSKCSAKRLSHKIYKGCLTLLLKNGKMDDNNENNVYTNQEILDLSFIHGKCDKVLSRTCRMFNQNYPHLPPMTKGKFRRIEATFVRFGRTGQALNRPKTVVDNEEKESDTLAYFEINSNASVRAAAEELGISRCSVQRILQKHYFHDYKFSLVQNLHPQDSYDRVNLCEMLYIRSQEEDNFSREGIFNRHMSGLQPIRMRFEIHSYDS
ncbi:hypothetical protein FQR65_LT14426 [Abscondita terminalis]|nr:hypothetical protein FQR65_LT14426 [Abscondita terminalis]